jgi:GH25 family lysozyme M1 (1,4-beta-N-acetylmuramidase)
MLRQLINLVTEPAPKGRAQGPDVSHWNVPRTPGQPVTTAFNPHTATERIDFVFQKITEGTNWIDPMVKENWQGVKDVPIRFAYHYQRAGQSWKEQVRHFYHVAQDYNFHGYVIDVEKTGNGRDEVHHRGYVLPGHKTDDRGVVEGYDECHPVHKL